MPRKTYRKIITSEESTKQINPNNIKLMDRFLKEKNTRSSDGTIKGYNSDLIIFFTWNLLNNENKYFPNIKKLDFADFFSYAVDELNWGSGRFARMRSALSQVSEFIIKFYDEDFPNYRNMILQAIELMPKVARREKTVLMEDQVDSLLNYLRYELNKPQEACLLALAIGSGARAAELLRFNTTIINEDCTAFDDIFLETIKAIKTKGRTKSGKMLVKYIIKDVFMPYYKDWLVEREKIMKANNKEHDSIFIKSNGDPISESGIRSWILKWEEFLGVPFYFHCLRHYTVSHLTRLGLESDFIIEIMGWTSADMYKVYNDVTAKERKWKGIDKLKKHLEEKGLQIEQNKSDEE